MQDWQIVVASAVAASIAAAALFLPEVARSPSDAATLLQTYWPGAISSGSASTLSRRSCLAPRARFASWTTANPNESVWIGRAAICCDLAWHIISAPSWYSSRSVCCP